MRLSTRNVLKCAAVKFVAYINVCLGTLSCLEKKKKSV